MTVLRTTRIGLARGLSRLAATLAVSAWTFAALACPLVDEGVVPSVPTSHAHLTDNTASDHQNLDVCGPARWHASATVQPVAMASIIQAAAMPPTPIAVVPAPVLAGPADIGGGVSVCADSHSHRPYRDFTTFWSHAPPLSRT